MNLKNMHWTTSGKAMAIVVVWLTRSIVFAQSPTWPDALPNSHVYRNTLALARISPEILSVESPDSSSVARRFYQQIQWLKPLSGNQAAYIAVDIPLAASLTHNRVIVFDQGDSTLDAIRKNVREKQIAFQRDKGYIAFSPHLDRHLNNSNLQGDRSELLESLGRVQNYPIQIGIALPDYTRRTLTELVPNLPSNLGGGASTTLVDSIRSVAIGLNPKDWTIEISLLFDNEKNAQASRIGKSLFQTPSDQPDLLTQIAQSIPKTEKSVSQMASYIASSASPMVKGRTVSWTHNSGSLEQRQLISVNTLSYLLGQSHTIDITNQIKQIGLACHNFESANRFMPPGKSPRDSNGRPLLSWRVHILPYLGESKLFEQFNLNEPWDSPHNKELISKMPRIYMGAAHMASTIPEGFTTLLAPAGNDTVLGDVKTNSLSNITDGTSNTIWVVEVKAELAVPWTSPQDYVFDAKDPARGLSDIGEEQFVAGMADGSVRRLPLTITAKNLVNLFQKSDGNIVEFK